MSSALNEAQVQQAVMDGIAFGILLSDRDGTEGGMSPATVLQDVCTLLDNVRPPEIEGDFELGYDTALTRVITLMTAIAGSARVVTEEKEPFPITHERATTEWVDDVKKVGYVTSCTCGWESDSGYVYRSSSIENFNDHVKENS